MDLATTVERIQQNFVICDPSLPDCPIVFASDAFLELTGYPREEVLGRNCRFLQVGFCAGVCAGDMRGEGVHAVRAAHGAGCGCRLQQLQESEYLGAAVHRRLDRAAAVGARLDHGLAPRAD
jgi:PAS domain-containing protein